MAPALWKAVPLKCTHSTQHLFNATARGTIKAQEPTEGVQRQMLWSDIYLFLIGCWGHILNLKKKKFYFHTTNSKIPEQKSTGKHDTWSSVVSKPNIFLFPQSSVCR